MLAMTPMFEPRFTINEKTCPMIADRKNGETFKAILTYRVIEKTKNFVVLQITFVQPERKLRIGYV